MILITGGSASGKSAFAEKLLAERASEEKTYLATMAVRGEEAHRRIERHRLQRAGQGYTTIECPVHIASVIGQCKEAVLLEDLGNLTANEMFPAGGFREEVAEQIAGELLQLDKTCRVLIVVTNEVFSDTGNYSTKTRQYIRELGRLNCMAAESAQEVWEVICGIPVRRK